MRFTFALAAVAAALISAPAAQAAILHYGTSLSGANEVPVNASTASGSATVDYDTALHTLLVHVDFTGLTGGPAAAAHIHCCANPGTAVTVAIGFPAFPAATSGTYDHLFSLTDISIYNTTFLSTFGGGTAVGAEAALAAGLAAPAHRAYVNIHNATFGGGEIRGNLAPEPSSLALMALSLAALGALSRKRRAKLS